MDESFLPYADKFHLLYEPEPNSGCWIWTGWWYHSGGYGGIGHTGTRAHRLSWEIHHGAIPPGLWVLHRCDVPPCVNPAHLFLGTEEDNVLDMVAKGRHRTVRGMAHKMTRYPDAMIPRIRARRAEGATFSVLSTEFGISATHAHRICSGQSRVFSSNEPVR